MSLLLFKERDQKLPSKEFFDGMWSKSASGGIYFLVENSTHNFDTYQCATKIKYEEAMVEILSLYSGDFSGRMVALFVSTHCGASNNELENSYTATTSDKDGNWLSIFGEGAFKNFSGQNNNYLPIKRFVTFCNTAFTPENVLDAKTIAQVLNNTNRVCQTNDKYLIIGSKTQAIYHNLVLDEDLGCFVSNDSYLPDITHDEKNYYLYASLSDAIKSGEIGTDTPKVFFEKLKTLQTIEIRARIKELTQLKGWPKFA
jgi:hypothetical protein